MLPTYEKNLLQADIQLGAGEDDLVPMEPVRHRKEFRGLSVVGEEHFH